MAGRSDSLPTMAGAQDRQMVSAHTELTGESDLNVEVGGRQGPLEPLSFTNSRVFYAIVVLCFSVTCGYATVLPSLWPLMQHLGAGHSEYAVAAASFSSGAFCGMLLLGSLADYLSPKPILLAATALSSVGCLMYCIPLDSSVIYPARFFWGIAVGTWSVVLATTRRYSSSMLEISKATTVASQAQTLGYIAGPGMAWLASLVRSSVTVYSGVEMQWLLPAVFTGLMLVSCFIAMSSLHWPVHSDPSCISQVKTPLKTWFIIGLQMVVNCTLASMLAVVESTGPAFTITSYNWSTTQNAVFWFIQAILGFGSATVLTGGLLEKWITTPAHLSLELWLAHGERSNAAYAQALVIVMSAITTPIKAVLGVTMTEEKSLNVKLHVAEKDLHRVAGELDSVPQVLRMFKVVQAAVYSSAVLVATQVVLLICSLMMINYTDFGQPVSSSRYVFSSVVASFAWTPGFVANLIGQQRSVPPGGAGWLFALQGSIACACRALAPIWSVPVWHHAGINMLFMIISAVYALNLGLALLILRHHKASASVEC